MKRLNWISGFEMKTVLQLKSLFAQVFSTLKLGNLILLPFRVHRFRPFLARVELSSASE